MKLEQFCGDGVTHRIPMAIGRQSYTPAEGDVLIFTAKNKITDADEDAVFQKALGAGLAVEGSDALVETVYEDTATHAGGNLVYDIQAQLAAGGKPKTVAYGVMVLKRDVTRLLETSVPVHTTQPPVPSSVLSTFQNAEDAGELVGTDEVIVKRGSSILKGTLNAIKTFVGELASVTWGSITGKPSTFAPSAHKASHASGGSDALTPADIGAETTAQLNARDTANRNRANHSGTQPLSTISDAGNSASRNVGTTAGTVAAGDDPRFSDARTPIAHVHAVSDLRGSGSAGQVLIHNGVVAPGDRYAPGYLAAQYVTGLAEVATTGDYNDLSNLPDLSVFDEVEQHANLAAFPVTGDVAKFYLAQNTGLLYRWTGSAYAEISAQLSLGETSTTAYRGDRGKTAYDHSQATGNPHGTTAAQVGAQPVNDNLTAEAGLTGAADRVSYFTGATTKALATFTAYARTLLALANKAAWQTELNFEDGADVTDAANVGSSIHGATAKTNPVDADTLTIIDSEAGNVLKKLTFANLWTWAKTKIEAATFTILRANAATLTTSALTSSASISWDASAISQPTLTLAHNATLTLSNLADGQTVSLGGTMGGSGSYTLALAHSGLTARQMGNPLSDIALLAANDLFEVSIKRVGTSLRYWVSTLEI